MDDAPPPPPLPSMIHMGRTAAFTLSLPESLESKVVHTEIVERQTDDEGRKLLNQYALLKTLGSGSYGKVRLAQDINTTQTYAIKIFSKKQLKKKREYLPGGPGQPMNVVTALDKVKKEIEIMQELSDSNVIQLYEVINDPEDDKLYMVLELGERGTLMQWNRVKGKYVSSWFESEPSPFGGLPPAYACKFFSDCVQGLQYLHSQRVVHRDIKPDNLMLSREGKLKLADLGVAHRFADDQLRTLADSNGTYSYLAPEACAGQEFDAYMADVWALGVTLYVMLYGVCPFSSEHPHQLFEMIQNDPVVFPTVPAESLSPALATEFSLFGDLISRLLTKQPADRIHLDEIKNHPWIVSHQNDQLDFDQLFSRHHSQDSDNDDDDCDSD
eukprot:TRINITY_DN2033_c0_g1_i1.p1 TRINITY_DN2033_c0_g1~~TRINITY_DN2033_c0_g1_i1.p1  ORF type:complete len:405 (+),score=126.25 TRINITY_DN2033_c0_g1_i1:62-1216(+)